MGLSHFETSPGGNATVYGLLHKLKSKCLVKSLHLYGHATYNMNIMNKTFQQGESNFSMLKPAINSCKVGLGNIVSSDLVLEELQKCRSKHFKMNSASFQKLMLRR